MNGGILLRCGVASGRVCACSQSVRSDFMDPRNRNSSQNSLPNDELETLKHLQKLQRDRKNNHKTVCDKGTGVIIQNVEDYIKS